MLRDIVNAYLICYNIHKENKNKMVYQTNKEKESLMKAQPMYLRAICN